MWAQDLFFLNAQSEQPCDLYWNTKSILHHIKATSPKLKVGQRGGQMSHGMSWKLTQFCLVTMICDFLWHGIYSAV